MWINLFATINLLLSKRYLKKLVRVYQIIVKVIKTLLCVQQCNMFYLLLITLAVGCLVSGNPVNILKEESVSPSEVVYVPYDVEYVPFQIVPNRKLHTEDNSQSKPVKNGDEDGSEDTIKVLPISTRKSDAKISQNIDVSLEDTTDFYSKDKSSSFDLFEENFNNNPAKSPEDFVLIPISVLRKLEHDTDANPSSKTHIIVKRQAPDNDFLVYTPVVRYRRIFRNRRRINRRPALVGYLNDYDDFPTVA